MVDKIILELPIPPSVNNAKGLSSKKLSKKKLIYYLKKAVLQFREEVYFTYLKIKKKSHKNFYLAKIRLKVRYSFKDLRRRDLDNYIKILQDALQKTKIFKDDSQIDKLILEREYTFLNKVIVELTTLPPIENNKDYIQWKKNN